MKSIGIIGCGWLGLELAKKWVAQEWKVKGTVRTTESAEELESAGIQSYGFALGNQLEKDFFVGLDVIVVSLPISTKNALTDYKHLFQQITQHKENQTCIVLTSSISVYNQLEGVIDEASAIKDRSAINYQVEELVRKPHHKQLTTVRLAGLISEDRHPINSLSGRENLKNGSEVTNLIHRNDVINLIHAIVVENAFGHVYNCVFPYHPLKAVYYQQEAQKRGLTPPSYESMISQQRIIDGSKCEEELSFSYQFPI